MEQRKIHAIFVVDEDRMEENGGIAPGDYFDNEVAALTDKGIVARDWRTADEDDEDNRNRYATYLINWAFEHNYEDGDISSPMPYEVWLAYEKSDPDNSLYVETNDECVGAPELIRVVNGEPARIRLTNKEADGVYTFIARRNRENDIRDRFEEDYAFAGGPTFEELAAVVPVNAMVDDTYAIEQSSDSWYDTVGSAIDNAFVKYQEKVTKEDKKDE